MMQSFLDRHGHAPTRGINMTPMIDVTFLLLFFFMVTSHIASNEKVALELPHPDNNQSAESQVNEKVIVNLRYVPDGAEPAFMLGAVPVNSMDELIERLDRIGRQNPRTQVILRADRRLSYGRVRDVMHAIAAANLTRLQVVTELGVRS